ncbi:MAG: hypothetical protein ALECFALPRED_007440 [Alectoria fallacina]|uniref:Uncharacterized protein n=1 Tax=Alectoria fallacina TaxID=1903189 RepID=A0A8H3GAH7_9LECA|nr:MAG: hypothetical protein ALECFALPRED_007440 [Alectoria fallacina]
MAPLNDAQLAEELVKVQDLLDRLEKLICRQSANPDGKFEDLLKAGTVKPSKKENQARNASDKAKSAVQKSQTARKSQADAKSKFDKTVADRANDKAVSTARGDFWKATAEADSADVDATAEVKRAAEKLEKAIKLRTGSHTRQAEEAAHQQARQAQEATDRQAREAQEAAQRKAQEAQESASSKVDSRVDTQMAIAEDLYHELYDADEAEEQREEAERAHDEKEAKLAREEAEEGARKAQRHAEQLRHHLVQSMFHELPVKSVEPLNISQIWDGVLQVFVRRENECM